MLTTPLQCSGIVLIDEIELHLHPEWQRKIVSSLRKTFPNIQFIITTHSPQVLGEIKDMDIFKLIIEDGLVKAQRIQSVKDTLISEQHFLCCYCCNRIHESVSHIEHFIPQSINPSKQLDYHNMFASCNGYVKDISTVNEESCGHRKKDWYDRNFIISPMDPECEEIFEFFPNGSIQPHDEDSKASNMIEHLGLNSYALRKAREAAIDTAYHNIGFYINNITQGALNAEIEFNNIPNPNGELPPFCDAVSYVLKNL